MLDDLKFLLPNRSVILPVWRGPFRGARIVANPRSSLRKICGLYEHELNGWLELALRRVSRLLDVGANDGYFSFGCAAAFRRNNVPGVIMCFEPQAQHVAELRRGIAAQGPSAARIEIVESLVGRESGPGIVTLDAVPTNDRCDTLIKIDVEGAEVDVVAGAASWLNASNLFVIEVHKAEYLDPLHQMFAAAGLTLLQVNQRPLPLIGRDTRDLANWWLVSDLGPPGRGT